MSLEEPLLGGRKGSNPNGHQAARAVAENGKQNTSESNVEPVSPTTARKRKRLICRAVLHHAMEKKAHAAAAAADSEADKPAAHGEFESTPLTDGNVRVVANKSTNATDYGTMARRQQSGPAMNASAVSNNAGNGWKSVREKVRTDSAVVGDKAWQAKRDAVEQSRIADSSLKIAALYMEDGIHGRLIGYSVAADTVKWYKVFHSNWWRTIYIICAALHMSFALFETTSTKASMIRIHDLLVSFELLFVCVYMTDMWFFLKVYGVAKLAEHRWTLARLLVIVLITVDIFCSIGSGYTIFRFSRPLRPLLLICRLRNIRKVFAGCLVAVPRICLVLGISAFLILFYAFAGYLFFWNVDDPDGHFASLSAATYTMLLLQTSVPTILTSMKPAFHHTPYSALFFVSFVLLGNIFLLKLLIAVSFRSYKRHTQEESVRALRKRKIALNAAFRLTSEHGHMSLSTWKRLLPYFHGSAVSDDVSVMLWRTVDVSNMDVISVKEFFQLCGLAHFKSPEKKWRYNSRRLERLRKSALLLLYRWVHIHIPGVIDTQIVVADACVDVLVLLSGVQLYMTANDSFGDFWPVFGLLLLLFFCAEMSVRLFVLGPRRYWQTQLHRVDLVCNFYGLIYFCAVGLETSAGNTHPALHSFVLIFRLLRFTKLLTLLQSSKLILRTIQSVMDKILYLFFVFLCILYIYAIIGIEIFQYRLTPEHCVNQADCSRWLAQHEQLSFTPFSFSFLTLFQVAIIGSWPLVMDAAVSVTSLWARAYFFTFRILVGMFYIPIFVGFVIESFVSHFTKSQFELEREQALAREKQRMREEDRAKRLQQREQRKKKEEQRQGLLLDDVDDEDVDFVLDAPPPLPSVEESKPKHEPTPEELSSMSQAQRDRLYVYGEVKLGRDASALDGVADGVAVRSEMGVSLLSANSKGSATDSLNSVDTSPHSRHYSPPSLPTPLVQSHRPKGLYQQSDGPAPEHGSLTAIPHASSAVSPSNASRKQEQRSHGAASKRPHKRVDSLDMEASVISITQNSGTGSDSDSDDDYDMSHAPTSQNAMSLATLNIMGVGGGAGVDLSKFDFNTLSTTQHAAHEQLLREHNTVLLDNRWKDKRIQQMAATVASQQLRIGELKRAVTSIKRKFQRYKEQRTGESAQPLPESRENASADDISDFTEKGPARALSKRASRVFTVAELDEEEQDEEFVQRILDEADEEGPLV